MALPSAASACWASWSLSCTLPPVTVTDEKPVTDVPGHTPALPLMSVVPVLVTVEPPRTAKELASPRLMSTGPARAAPARRQSKATLAIVWRSMNLS